MSAVGLLNAQRLTPPASDAPRINGPKVYGNRPGTEFIYRIPASGQKPMTFSAEGLPEGLKLDTATGIISGVAPDAGTYEVVLHARNGSGECERVFRIEIGDALALTPPMGWNSWNCCGYNVTAEKVAAAAAAMDESGLADYGWSYINIDDGWQGVRGGEWNAIQPNGKFPDMAGLVKLIHSYGLKAGIYSGPWQGTYAGYAGESTDNPEGKYWWIEKGWMKDDTRFYDPDCRYKEKTNHFHAPYSFVTEDVRQWADWGFDYLKYDWRPNDWYHLQEMGDALLASGRSFVYSISNSAPYALGPKLREQAHCWRTTKDIYDNWESMSGIGFSQDGWAGFRGPGSWPDADMLVVGRMAWWHREAHPSRLTPDEQYTHISLWALLSAPMLIGCDLTELDDFTLGLLTNSEVIDINQDTFGIQAVKAVSGEGWAVYVKPLDDGSLAVGLFNTGETTCRIGFVPQELGLLVPQTVRDVWRQKDIAEIAPGERFECEVGRHGAVLLRVWPGVTRDRLTGKLARELRKESVPEPNYDESKVGQYTLPDPLEGVKSRRQWEKKRRPQLLLQFETEMFGKSPDRPEGMHFEIVESGTYGGFARRKQVSIWLDREETQRINLLLYLPMSAEGPVPVFAGVNLKGNWGVAEDTLIIYPDSETIRRYGALENTVRGGAASRWPIKMILDAGYGVATYYRGDIDPDYDDGFVNGIQPLFYKEGQIRPEPDEWGTVAAWSWGLSRVLDYLSVDPDTDASKTIAIGHSRMGKAALWAGASDTRFAMVISNDSGCCGAALSRRNYGETVDILNRNFPHWFCRNFKKYGGNESALPFDQHTLIALIAPRPVYVASSSEDRWADPAGEGLSLEAAAPVYRMYGCESSMGRHVKQGPHSITAEDWAYFINFADIQLKK